MARLIDANALIDEIKHTLWDWESVDGIKSSTVLKQTISDINNMPTIDAEPIRHGHYIGESDGYADGYPVYDIWSCSECGCYFEDWDDKPTYKYCPNCGALMEAKDEDY